MIDTLTSPESLKNCYLFVPSVWRNYKRDVLTNGFTGAVAKHPLGAFVPTPDDSVKILANDGIVGGFHDGCQLL